MRVLVVSNVADPLPRFFGCRGYDAIAVYGVEEALALGRSRRPGALVAALRAEIAAERQASWEKA